MFYFLVFYFTIAFFLIIVGGLALLTDVEDGDADTIKARGFFIMCGMFGIAMIAGYLMTSRLLGL